MKTLTMKYLLAFALAFGLGASAQAATPAAHSTVAAKSGIAAGMIVTGDKQALDAKAKTKKKKKKKKA